MKQLITAFFILISVKAAFSQIGYTQTGNASFYAKKFDGKKTACGEKYSAKQLTAAHKSLPFQCLVKVQNIKNQKEVIVRINDRGPFSKDKIIDLSSAAAEKIGIISDGVGKVKLEVIALNSDFPLQSDSMCLRDNDLITLNTIKDYENNKIYDMVGNEAKPKGYGIQIASLTDIKNVLKQYLFLEQKDVENVYTEVNDGYKKKHYRILVGDYPNAEKAEIEKTKLKDAGIEGYIKKYDQ